VLPDVVAGRLARRVNGSRSEGRNSTTARVTWVTSNSGNRETGMIARS
jgi:hypothetical protein